MLSRKRFCGWRCYQDDIYEAELYRRIYNPVVSIMEILAAKTGDLP